MLILHLCNKKSWGLKSDKEISDPVLFLTYLTSTVDKILAFDLSFICLHASNLTFFDHYMENACPVIDLNTCSKVKKGSVSPSSTDPELRHLQVDSQLIRNTAKARLML